jgi:hypothetical protein
MQGPELQDRENVTYGYVVLGRYARRDGVDVCCGSVVESGASTRSGGCERWQRRCVVNVHDEVYCAYSGNGAIHVTAMSCR